MHSRPFQFTAYAQNKGAESEGQVQSLRDRMLTDAFWRWAWCISLIVAMLAGVACYEWWDDIVRVWPAAARLYLPG